MRIGKRGWIVLVVGFALVAVWMCAWLNVHSLPRPVAAIANVDSDLTVRMAGGLRVHDRFAGNAPLAAAALNQRAGVRATANGDVLTVDFGGVSESQAAFMAAMIRRPLRLQHVVAGSSFMRDVFARVSRGSDADAQALGVTGDTDAWRNERDYAQHLDWYLTAPSADGLRAYVDKLAARGVVPPDGMEVGYQLSPARGSKPAEARTYLLEKTAIIDASMVTHASIIYDPQTNQPNVLVDLDPRGDQRFGDFTANHIGEKVATSIGDVIKSAPVIGGAIRGGSFSMSMSGVDAQAKQREAESLVSVLSSGPLPDGSTVIDATFVAADAAALARNRTAKTLFALVIGLIAAVLLRMLQRFVVGMTHVPVAHTPVRSNVWLRCLVTVAGLALLWLGRGWILPGLNKEELANVLAKGGGAGDLSSVSVFALGLSPIISAFVIVELIALAVPRWRTLRIGDSRQRRALGQAVALLAVVLASVQAYFVCSYLRGLPDDLAFSSGPLSSWTAGFSLVGGTFALAVLAAVISKRGIGNGFAVLFIGNQFSNWLVNPASHGLTEKTVALAGATFCLVIASTVAMLRSHVRDTRGSVATTMAIPNSGILPLNWSSSLLVFAATMQLSNGPLSTVLDSKWWSMWRGTAVAFATLIIATLVCAWAFSGGEDRDASAPSALVHRGSGRHLWLRATVLSLLFVTTIFLLHVLLQGFMPVGAMVLFILGTAVVMDIVEECVARRNRKLVSVWPLHQAMRADGIRSALREANIDAHLRGRNLRMLMQFFAPWNPIEVLVPHGDADRAQELLRASRSNVA